MQVGLQWGKPARPTEVKIDPTVDMKTPPRVQLDRMPAAEFFAYAAELLKITQPHVTDQPIIARLEAIGFEPGKSFDLGKADPVVQRGLANAPRDAQELMAWKLPTLARAVNGWSMNTDTVGVWGNYYLKRAAMNQAGPRVERTRRCLLPAEYRRSIWQAARRRKQIHTALR
jgi:hypothetical protein